MTIVELMGLLMKAGVVFGLLAITVRMLRRLDGGKRGGKRRGGRLAALAGVKGSRRHTTLDIVERKPLGRSSSVVLLRVRDQHWVVGVTEQQVQVLLEVDVEDEDEPVVDLRAAGRGRGQVPGWGDLGRMLRERVPLLRIPKTEDVHELVELEAGPLARPLEEEIDDLDDEGPIAATDRTRLTGRARR